MKCRNCARDIPPQSLFCNWCGAKQIKEKKKEIKVPRPERLPSGNYRIKLTKEGVSVTEDTPEKVTAKAIAIRAGYLKEEKKHPKMTVDEMIGKYIDANSNILSPVTIRGYESTRKFRFRSASDLDVYGNIEWQQLINEEASQVSPKTLANAWRLITVSMRYQGIPVPDVKLPRIAKSERPWMDYKQIQSFIPLIHDKECEIPALLALSGLRKSEILDLTAEDIDLTSMTINVSGAVVPDKNGNFVHKETNKNKSSQRVVPITIPRLQELLKNVSEGPVCTSTPNAPYFQINKICKENGLPEVGWHGLRHSFCSLAYHLKWSEATTMAVGGWSDTKVVHNVYTHLSSLDKSKDIKRMERFYKTGK